MCPIHWNDYDNCEDDGNHFDCWNDDWDYDGDGEPDWFDHQNNYDEESGEWIEMGGAIHNRGRPHNAWTWSDEEVLW